MSMDIWTGPVTYLFEGELDGLILAQLQDVHELHDRFVAAVQLVLTLDQLFLLLREVDKLVQSFLVDVAVLLQLSVALLQFSEQLLKEEIKTWLAPSEVRLTVWLLV